MYATSFSILLSLSLSLLCLSFSLVTSKQLLHTINERGPRPKAYIYIHSSSMDPPLVTRFCSQPRRERESIFRSRLMHRARTCRYTIAWKKKEKKKRKAPSPFRASGLFRFEMERKCGKSFFKLFSACRRRLFSFGIKRFNTGSILFLLSFFTTLLLDRAETKRNETAGRDCFESDNVARGAFYARGETTPGAGRRDSSRDARNKR